MEKYNNQVINPPYGANIPIVSDNRLDVLMNNNPQKIINFINAIENNLKTKAKIKFTKIQLGDVPKTHSSTKKIQSWIGFKPKTTIKFGIKKFVEWYVQYYKIKNIK